VKTYNLDLDFSSDPLFGEKGNATIQRAQIYVKTHSSSEDRLLLITPVCASAGELDGQIDRLHAELEEIRKTGHRKFIAAERANQEI
jgi:hypothetical protein